MSTLFLSLIFSLYPYSDTADYQNYHQQIIHIEEMIVDEQYNVALDEYVKLFDQYDYIFKRDLKIAADLSLFLKRKEQSISLISTCLSRGWELKSFQKDRLKELLSKSEYENLRQQASQLHQQYISNLDLNTKEAVHHLFKEDQKMALKGFLKWGDKAQEKFMDSKFAPHSEKQMKTLKHIIISKGYPGEQLIGNNYWGATVISHHNSMSYNYVKRDTLFTDLKPYLIESLRDGQLSPYEMALMEDWRNAVLRDSSTIAFGYVNPPTIQTLKQINKNRYKIGLRSIELRNKLVKIEKKVGLKFYLPDWVKGEILILEEED
ncbi:hypothetical protein [Flammeovirga sp. EKP202]|uniref:hypothetical protein n=1 Tax=Flammeovirga sp. EKP202 TaxID=2770592 RepID=UPI00165F6380|nr:hypothetical protein [Flammeovirga sp. EKP202]MBD0400681.1 hypothetical protein [Flammeovirga sp. EKP202]